MKFLNIKNISFQFYLLILIFFIIIFSALTFYFSDFLFKKENEKTKKYIKDDIDFKKNIEDLYFNFNDTLNMDDFFFPNFNVNKGFEDLNKDKLINKKVFKDLWIKKENLFSSDIEKASDFVVDKILEKIK